MSNPSDDGTPMGKPILSPSQSETDFLLQTVNEQLERGTFEASDRELLGRMVASLADGRGIVRLGFVEAFGQIGKLATPTLMRGLSRHPNPVVRRSCAKALAQVADPEAVPVTIEALLHDEDTVVRASSAGALARMGELAVTALLDVIASPDNPPATKGQATWALSFIGTEATKLLFPAIQSDSAEVRCAVVGAIGHQEEQIAGDRQAMTILLAALEDSSPLVRAEAVTALGKVSAGGAFGPLLACLPDEDDEVRKAVALRLMKLKDRRAIEPLQHAIECEPKESVRKVIQLAISQLSLHAPENK